MTTLKFTIQDWLGPADSEAPDDIALASLRIDVGDNHSRVTVTDVYDSIARTVRDHVNVSAYHLAEWLLVNWWRLRWEASGEGYDWAAAHALAAVGEGFAWPPLEISSDGEFVQLRMEAESACDVAAIRYLNPATVEIPASDFERAVDTFVDEVVARLSACGRGDELAALRDELAGERANDEAAALCALQARAGIDPGEAPPGWDVGVDQLRREAGPQAVAELAAELPRLPHGPVDAHEALMEIARSPHVVDLSAFPPTNGAVRGELPWQKGARLATDTRRRWRCPAGPLPDALLGDMLHVSLPLVKTCDWVLGGGRLDKAARRTHIALPTDRPNGQRFYLARLIASALLRSPDDSYMAITRAGTAMQKAERSFAQEFLCPWPDLEAYTDANGSGEDDIAAAADYFRVSEWTVLSALVNHGKLPRHRLPAELR